MGRIAASAWELTAGRVEPSLYSSGAPSGALASVEATNAAGQSSSFTRTTACGRDPEVRPGYTARATAAASITGLAPPSRVVFFVARPPAPAVLTWAIGPPEALEEEGEDLPQPASATQASRAAAGRSVRTFMGGTLSGVPAHEAMLREMPDACPRRDFR